MNPKTRTRRQRAASKRKNQKRRDMLDYIATHFRGLPVEVEYDPAAPTLTRVVQGLETSRVRTVRINGSRLTLIENPV